MKRVLHCYMFVTSLIALIKLYFAAELFPLALLIIFIVWINMLLNIYFILSDENKEPLEGYTVVIWAISIIILGK